MDRLVVIPIVKLRMNMDVMVYVVPRIRCSHVQIIAKELIIIHRELDLVVVVGHFHQPLQIVP